MKLLENKLSLQKKAHYRVQFLKEKGNRYGLNGLYCPWTEDEFLAWAEQQEKEEQSLLTAINETNPFSLAHQSEETPLELAMGEMIPLDSRPQLKLVKPYEEEPLDAEFLALLEDELAADSAYELWSNRKTYLSMLYNNGEISRNYVEIYEVSMNPNDPIEARLKTIKDFSRAYQAQLIKLYNKLANNIITEEQKRGWQDFGLLPFEKLILNLVPNKDHWRELINHTKNQLQKYYPR